MKKVFLLASLFGLFTLCSNAQSTTPNKSNSKNIAKNTTKPKQSTTSSSTTVTPTTPTQKTKTVAIRKKHHKRMNKKAPAKQ